MLIENEFIVQGPMEQVWAYLLDVERVAPCMPGAQLTDVVDDHTWKGKTNIKVGPVSLSFAGTVVMDERDDAGHRVVLSAKGMEQRGKGAASAKVESHLEEVDGGATKVVMRTDLTISGAVAQYGRGMVLDISQRLTREFADCLQTNMAAAEPEAPGRAEPAAAPATKTAQPAQEASPSGDGAEPEASGGAGPKPPAAPSPTPPQSEAQFEAQPRRPPVRPAQSARPAAPVRGIRLTLWALWRALVRWIERLFGSSRE